MRNAGREAALGASGTAFARGGTAVFAAGFYLGRDFSGGPAYLVGTTGSDAVDVSSATGVISAIAVGSSALTSLCSRAVGSPVQARRCIPQEQASKQGRSLWNESHYICPLLSRRQVMRGIQKPCRRC